MGAAVMGGVMAATGAVSGMPVAVPARSPLPFSSVPLSGATASARSRSRSRPEPPPGLVPGASHRASRFCCPRPLKGWPPWLPTAGSGSARTEQGSGGHPAKGWSPPFLSLLHELLQLRAAAFPLSGCAALLRALTLRPPQPMGPWSAGGRTHRQGGLWGSPEAQGPLCSGGFVSPLSPRAGGTWWAGVEACRVVVLGEVAESGSNQGFSVRREA